LILFHALLANLTFAAVTVLAGQTFAAKVATFLGSLSRWVFWLIPALHIEITR
jgi:hypothetical protein